jgi:hypothetical protein
MFNRDGINQNRGNKIIIKINLLDQLNKKKIDDDGSKTENKLVIIVI